MPNVSKKVWRDARLHCHLRKEWNAGKWSGAEVSAWSDDRWVLKASRGAIVLGVFATEDEAWAARTLIYLFGE